MSDIHLERREVEERSREEVVDMEKLREVETKNETEENSEARVCIRSRERRMGSLKKIKKKMDRKKKSE